MTLMKEIKVQSMPLLLSSASSDESEITGKDSCGFCQKALVEGNGGETGTKSERNESPNQGRSSTQPLLLGQLESQMAFK